MYGKSAVGIEKNNIQIYINKKEVAYSRQNMIRAINTFLLYLTNPDLDELNDRCKALKEHRRQQEQLTKLEKNRTPILSNRYDTPILEHDQTWGNEYE
jgi:hypothetical protein